MKSALRLRRPADFAAVRADGRRFWHPALVLAFHVNGLARNRYGFVTGRRLGKAVVRNRIKRRLRAAMYQMHDRLLQGYDIVVTARPMALAQPFHELKRILNALLSRARLIEES